MATNVLVQTKPAINELIPNAIDKLSNDTLIAEITEEDSFGSTIRFHYSSDNGANWTDTTDDIAASSGTPVADMFIDSENTIWAAYGATDAKIHIVPGTFSEGSITWGTSREIWAADNTGEVSVTAWVVGTDTFIALYGIDGWEDAFLIVTKRTSGGTYSQVSSWTESVTSSPSAVSIDFHHTGNGKTLNSGTPHLYTSTTTSTDFYFRKHTYSSGPSWSAGDKVTLYANTSGGPGNMYYDGTRIVASAQKGSDPFAIAVERDEADTTTTVLTTVPTGSGYDFTYVFYDRDKNVYMIAPSSAAEKIEYCKYDRGSSSWGSWEDFTGPGLPEDAVVCPFPIAQTALLLFDDAGSIYFNEILTWPVISGGWGSIAI